MARVKTVRKPTDHPNYADETTRKDLADLFQQLFPQKPDAGIDTAHDGIAIAALNPKLAQHLAKLSTFIAGELRWCQRRDLRELAIQALNLRLKSDYSFRTRTIYAEKAGISAELLAALPSWKSSCLFDEEQRLVIEYAEAVASGSVPHELFSRVVARFGEKEAVECTALIAFWAFWAMFLNATRPDPDPSR